MDLKELVKKSRSYRRYDNSVKIEKQTLLDLIDLIRFAPTGSNMRRSDRHRDR